VKDGDCGDGHGELATASAVVAENPTVLQARKRVLHASPAAALPTAPCNQPILDHHLGNPSLWHKVDLVRTQAPHAPGGWRYEAHLMVLKEPYLSPSARTRRAEVALAETGRVAGIDVNVSNLTIASQVEGGELRLTRVERDAPTKERDVAAGAASGAASGRWSGRGVRQTGSSTDCRDGRRSAPVGAQPPASE
jgi:hypothetical protein